MTQSLNMSKKLPLILDTNIIIYLSQTSTEKQLKTELASLESKYHLTISKITQYEILKHAETKKGSKVLELLKLFESFEITEEVLIVAALLHRLFGVLHPNIKLMKKEIEKIIV